MQNKTESSAASVIEAQVIEMKEEEGSIAKKEIAKYVERIAALLKQAGAWDTFSNTLQFQAWFLDLLIHVRRLAENNQAENSGKAIHKLIEKTEKFTPEGVAEMHTFLDDLLAQYSVHRGTKNAWDTFVEALLHNTKEKLEDYFKPVCDAFAVQRFTPEEQAAVDLFEDKYYMDFTRIRCIMPTSLALAEELRPLFFPSPDAVKKTITAQERLDLPKIIVVIENRTNFISSVYEKWREILGESTTYFRMLRAQRTQQGQAFSYDQTILGYVANAAKEYRRRKMLLIHAQLDLLFVEATWGDKNGKSISQKMLVERIQHILREIHALLSEDASTPWNIAHNNKIAASEAILCLQRIEKNLDFFAAKGNRFHAPLHEEMQRLSNYLHTFSPSLITAEVPVEALNKCIEDIFALTFSIYDTQDEEVLKTRLRNREEVWLEQSAVQKIQDSKAGIAAKRKDLQKKHIVNASQDVTDPGSIKKFLKKTSTALSSAKKLAQYQSIGLPENEDKINRAIFLLCNLQQIFQKKLEEQIDTHIRIALCDVFRLMEFFLIFCDKAGKQTAIDVVFISSAQKEVLDLPDLYWRCFEARHHLETAALLAQHADSAASEEMAAWFAQQSEQQASLFTHAQERSLKEMARIPETTLPLLQLSYIPEITYTAAEEKEEEKTTFIEPVSETQWQAIELLLLEHKFQEAEEACEKIEKNTPLTPQDTVYLTLIRTQLSTTALFVATKQKTIASVSAHYCALTAQTENALESLERYVASYATEQAPSKPTEAVDKIVQNAELLLAAAEQVQAQVAPLASPLVVHLAELSQKKQEPEETSSQEKLSATQKRKQRRKKKTGTPAQQHDLPVSEKIAYAQTTLHDLRDKTRIQKVYARLQQLRDRTCPEKQIQLPVPSNPAFLPPPSPTPSVLEKTILQNIPSDLYALMKELSQQGNYALLLGLTPAHIHCGNLLNTLTGQNRIQIVTSTVTEFPVIRICLVSGILVEVRSHPPLNDVATPLSEALPADIFEGRLHFTLHGLGLIMTSNGSFWFDALQRKVIAHPEMFSQFAHIQKRELYPVEKNLETTQYGALLAFHTLFMVWTQRCNVLNPLASWIHTQGNTQLLAELNQKGPYYDHIVEKFVQLENPHDRVRRDILARALGLENSVRLLRTRTEQKALPLYVEAPVVFPLHPQELACFMRAHVMQYLHNMTLGGHTTLLHGGAPLDMYWGRGRLIGDWDIKTSMNPALFSELQDDTLFVGGVFRHIEMSQIPGTLFAATFLQDSTIAEVVSCPDLPKFADPDFWERLAEVLSTCTICTVNAWAIVNTTKGFFLYDVRAKKSVSAMQELSCFAEIQNREVVFFDLEATKEDPIRILKGLELVWKKGMHLRNDTKAWIQENGAAALYALSSQSEKCVHFMYALHTLEKAFGEKIQADFEVLQLSDVIQYLKELVAESREESVCSMRP